MDHDHHRRVGPPDPEALKRLKGYEAREREAGLTGEETAVLYEEGFSLKAPRGYWILEYLGYPKISVLQDGTSGWRKDIQCLPGDEDARLRERAHLLRLVERVTPGREPAHRA